MPALSVSIDGNAVATVSTDGYQVVAVRAGGARTDAELASLDVDGGAYPDQGSPTYLTWVLSSPLKPGQVVTVHLLKSAETSHAGKTIAEMFPDEAPVDEAAFKPTAERFEEIRARPILREIYSFRFESSLGTDYAGETTSVEHGFGFSVLWNWLSPERANVSLHSYTLESLETGGPMRNHVQERLSLGGSVRFELIV